jgi:aspartate/methionine/tyrosine aminotransferase
MSYLAEAVPKGLLQTKPNAAFYALINIGNLGGEAAFAFMLERNVSTCPGVKFGENARNSVRISLAGSKDNFEKDIEMLTSALTEWNNKSVFYSS